MKTFYSIIKKSVITGIGLAAASLSLHAASLSLTVQSGMMTNMFAGFNNPIFVTSVAVASQSGSGGLGQLIDTPTNALGFVTPAYSNTVSYATNYAQTWTNFYGIVQTGSTNTYLIDLTNNVVAATTNLYPVRVSIFATNGLTTTYYNVNSMFNNGIWATNGGSGPLSITISY